MPESSELQTFALSDSRTESIKDRPVDEELALSVRGLLSVNHQRIHIAEVVRRVYGTKKVGRPIFKDLLGKMDDFVQAGLLIYEPPAFYKAIGPWAEKTVVPTDDSVLEIVQPKPHRRRRPSEEEVKTLDEMIRESGISAKRPVNPDSRQRRQRPGFGRNHRRH